jgi:PIN domain nuclease of toxin-antitoxin system
VPDEYLALLLDGGVQPLPVSIEHAAGVERLAAHHSDPFDRMLVSQATVEGAAIVSGDDALRSYGVTLIW